MVIGMPRYRGCLMVRRPTLSIQSPYAIFIFSIMLQVRADLQTLVYLLCCLQDPIADPSLFSACQIFPLMMQRARKRCLAEALGTCVDTHLAFLFDFIAGDKSLPFAGLTTTILRVFMHRQVVAIRLGKRRKLIVVCNLVLIQRIDPPCKNCETMLEDDVPLLGTCPMLVLKAVI